MAAGQHQAYKPQRKAGAIIGVVFTMIGFLLILGGGLWAHKTTKFIDAAEQAQGEVIEMVARRGNDSTTYAPRFRFGGPDGQWYIVTSSHSSNPPAYRVGEQVTVLYEPGNPAEAKLQGFMSLWFGPIMLGIMGGVFGFIGLVTFLFQRRRQQNQAFLLARGRPYMAEFQRVEREHDTEEGNSRFYVIARYYDKASHQVQVFRSDPLDFDPSDFIKDGQLITVLIHQDKPGVYYMDLSFLPQKA